MLGCRVSLGGQKQQPTPVALQPSQRRLHWKCVGSGATETGGSPSCCAAAGLFGVVTHTVCLVFFYGDTVWLGRLEVLLLFPSLLPLLPVKCHRIYHAKGLVEHPDLENRV